MKTKAELRSRIINQDKLYNNALKKIKILKKRLNYIEGVLDDDPADLESGCLSYKNSDDEIRRLVNCPDLEIDKTCNFEM